MYHANIRGCFIWGGQGLLALFLWLSCKLKFISTQQLRKEKNMSPRSQPLTSVCIWTPFCWIPKSVCFPVCRALPVHTLQTAVLELVKTGLGHPFQKNYFTGETGSTIRHKPIYFQWGKWGTDSLKCTRRISTLSSVSQPPRDAHL